uniref:SNTX MACPF/CDC-like domain-containing protein n=1 Tax=Panagrolaimus davidi TaxID=227884 RepID=A0A914Q229_9BILA
MKYDFSNSTSSKLSLLGIEGEFKLNLMCKAIVDASGSAAFAKHMNTTKNEMRCTFAFSSSTGESDININDERIHQYFKKDIKDSCGTHIVIRITLGASATAELFVETNDESCKIEMKEKLEANIGKANEWLNAGFNENAQYKDDELTNITNIRFNTYGAINVKKPNNVQEALEIINGLQETLDNQDNSHVLEFHLLPLNTLKEAIGKGIFSVDRIILC